MSNNCHIKKKMKKALLAKSSVRYQQEYSKKDFYEGVLERRGG
jgi:hypothetical protein